MRSKLFSTLLGAGLVGLALSMSSATLEPSWYSVKTAFRTSLPPRTTALRGLQAVPRCPRLTLVSPSPALTMSCP